MCYTYGFMYVYIYTHIIYICLFINPIYIYTHMQDFRYGSEFTQVRQSLGLGIRWFEFPLGLRLAHSS